MDKIKYQDTVEGLLKYIGVDLLQINTTEDDQGAINIDLETHDAPLLIGRHGSGLQALEQVTSLILRCNNADEEAHIAPVHIDVGGYKDQYEERLIELANKKAARVIAEGIRETFHPLNSYHRRLVHLHIAEYFPELETDSLGTGATKRLILRKKETGE